MSRGIGVDRETVIGLTVWAMQQHAATGRLPDAAAAGRRHGLPEGLAGRLLREVERAIASERKRARLVAQRAGQRPGAETAAPCTAGAFLSAPPPEAGAAPRTFGAALCARI